MRNIRGSAPPEQRTCSKDNSTKLGPLYTKAWEPLTHDIQIMWLVQRLEVVQVYFILDLEGMSDEEIQMGEKSTWHLALGQVENVSRSTMYCVTPIKRRVPHKARGCTKHFNCYELLRILYGHGGVLDHLLFWMSIIYILRSLNMVHTFTLY